MVSHLLPFRMQILHAVINIIMTFHTLPDVELCVKRYFACDLFNSGVNQFCQDIVDMICPCPSWCTKLLLYFKACWVFCTPFLLLVSVWGEFFLFVFFLVEITDKWMDEIQIMCVYIM